MKLRDFQIFPLGKAVELPEQERAEMICRSELVSESVRLALRKVRPEAHTDKLLIRLDAGSGEQPKLASAARLDGLDMCCVTVTVDVRAVLEARSIEPIVEAARIGVDSAREFIGAGHGLIHALLERTASGEPPCNHPFETLSRRHRATGTEFSVWFRADLGCRFWVAVDHERDGVRTEVVVFESHRVTYVEDDFPMARSAIKGDDFVIYDKSNQVVARVPVSSGNGSA